MEDLRYPIGSFSPPGDLDGEARKTLIDQIAAAPAHLREAVAGLDDARLDTPYRPGGWTVRQVVHHLPDSHANAYVRFKLALTEETPTIGTYDEAAWAELGDSRAPIALSLDLLEALHERWVLLLRSLAPRDFARTLHHPEFEDLLSLDVLLALYAWHGRHHVAHITSLVERMG